MVDSEGRATRRYGRRDARHVSGHDVRVTFDNNDLPRLTDVALGEIETVEHLGLVIHRGLRGVEVLGTGVVVTELAGTKPNRLPGHIADGPDQAFAEAVVNALLSLR